MDFGELSKWQKHAADWAFEYHSNLRDRPVRPDIEPGDFLEKLDQTLPENPEPIETIFNDFVAHVPDAMTHWQHPRFFAYFPANAAPASMLAEQIANAMGSQALIWQASPAATEMEGLVVNWLCDALGLPEEFTGVIHDTATTATFSAITTMRELALGHEGLTKGLSAAPKLRIYASDQTHSSIDKAVRLSGIGQDNLVKIPLIPNHPTWSLDPQALDQQIIEDRARGYKPAGVVLCVGGTSIGACDDIAAAISVAHSHGLRVHVDAAWAGSAMICDKYRQLWAGIEQADSVLFNPHKWLGAQLDCSVQFLRDPSAQIATMGLRPDYLKTQGHDEIVNYNEWTLPLGRRFRALKLWFLLRNEGLSGLRQRIENHVNWANEVAETISQLDGFSLTTPPILSLFSFQYIDDEKSAKLIELVNKDGRIYLTQTTHDGRFVIRVCVGQFSTTREDVMMIPQVLQEIAQKIG